MRTLSLAAAVCGEPDCSGVLAADDRAGLSYVSRSVS
jgi:hypothetical protein